MKQTIKQQFGMLLSALMSISVFVLKSIEKIERVNQYLDGFTIAKLSLTDLM